MDWGLYKYRHLVKNAFAGLKHFRAIATRYDKLKRNFESLIALACAFLWLPKMAIAPSCELKSLTADTHIARFSRARK